MNTIWRPIVDEEKFHVSECAAYRVHIKASHPSLTKVKPILADSDAIRKSHARVMHIPAPMAWPLIAAMVGTVRVLMFRKRL